jgi:DNA-binding NarL/FixJ family response regulator
MSEIAPSQATKVDDQPVAQTTVVIVDDHRSFAELLAAALENVPGLTCIGIATSAAAGVARAVELRPDIVVMDIQMPRQDGLVAAKSIRDAMPDTIIAIVTAHHDPQWVSKAAQAGASAFIPKDGSLAEMIDILKRVRHGQMLVAPATFREQAHQVGPLDDALPLLSHRELEVLTCLSQGMQVPGIARALGISLHTCRGYVKTMHAKMGVRTQLEAVIKAQQIGLLGPNG